MPDAPTYNRVFVPVDVVFPNCERSLTAFREKLAALSLTDTLFWCARLNLVVCNSRITYKEGQEFGLRLLNETEIERINAFVKDQGAIESTAIFFRGQLLEVVRWTVLLCCDTTSDGETFEDPEIRRRFAEVLLSAGDVWSCRVFDVRFSLEGGIELGRERALGAIRKGIEATSQAPEVYRSVGRGWLLFTEYMPRFYAEFASEFESLKGISLQDYYYCLSWFAATFFNVDTESIFDATNIGEGFRGNDLFRLFLELESQTPTELKSALWGDTVEAPDEADLPFYDYLPLRRRPILRTEDGRGIIIDPIFFLEKASIGPLFHLSEGQTRNYANRLFGAFGDAFEEYACDILRRMYPSGGGLVSRLACNVSERTEAGQEVQIDAVLNDYRELVLFEMKAVFIREDKILTDDHEDFLKQLREKYGVSEGEKHDRRVKGVGQLGRIIKILANKEWFGEQGEFEAARTIYPILVVHDELLDAPLYGHFLANEFRDLVQPDEDLDSGGMRKGDLLIKRPIILTVEDLENLEESTENFALRDLLSDYSDACPDRSASLHNFIHSSPNYREKMLINQEVSEKGLQVLERARECLIQ